MKTNKNFVQHFIHFFIRAVRSPTDSPSDTRLFARLMMKPVIFDLYALFVQVNDRRRSLNLTIPDDQDQSATAIAIRHNAKQIVDKFATISRRVEPIYQIATTPWRDLRNEKILIIGCRNVLELHQAKFAGFKWENITGLDLFSVNPKILAMNMEDMSEIRNETYDVVTLVNTLNYSLKPYETFAEVVRILRPGGRFVFTYRREMGQHSEHRSRYSGELLLDEPHSYPARDHVSFLQQNGMQLFWHDERVKTDSTSGNLASRHRIGLIKKDTLHDPIFPE